MKFSQFLKSFKEDVTPFGDLARVFIQSKSKATTYLGVRADLDKHNADYIVYKILDEVYELYKNNNVV